jgi:hypothetical protein
MIVFDDTTIYTFVKNYFRKPEVPIVVSFLIWKRMKVENKIKKISLWMHDFYEEKRTKSSRKDGVLTALATPEYKGNLAVKRREEALKMLSREERKLYKYSLEKRGSPVDTPQKK